MGTVSLLSGQPKEGIAYVEAQAESKGYYEEATTDNSGYFWLRGLLPETTYLIKVVLKDENGIVGIERRASPESLAVKVGSEDIKGVDFIVFEQPEVTILSGHVEGTGLESLQHLLVEIKSASEISKVESVLPLPLSYYFQIRDLPKGKHLVQLRSGLPSNTHNFESEIIEVDLEKHPQIHIGPIRYSIEEQHHMQEPTAAPIFRLVMGLAVIVVFITMPRLKNLYQAIVEMTPLGASTASSKKEVRKQVVRKRAY